MALSSLETYNVVTGGGIRGSVGKLSGTRFYYNNYYWTIVPQDTPEPFMQVTQAQVIAGGYISPNPYFVCDPEHPYYFNDKKVTSVRYRLHAEPNPDPSSPDLYSAYQVVGEYLYEDGTIAGTTVTGMDFTHNTGDYVNICYGGWINSSGEYNVGLVTCWPTVNMDDNIIECGVEGIVNMPDSSTGLAAVWGDGQTPMEDDGVTPTGGSGGGGGTYSRPDETVEIPGLPSISVCNTGFTRVYEVTDQNMRDFAAFLWSDGFYDNIIKNFNSPMENIISLSIIPNVGISGTTEQIYIGNMQTNIAGEKLSTTYYRIDCGSIKVNEYYKNFVDYQTGLQIYLPYIGIRDVPIDDCMNGTIHVEYHVDVFSGSLVAFIQTQVGDGASHVVATYEGNCASQIPLSGVNYVSMYQGLLGVAGSMATSNPIGMAEGLMSTKPSYLRSGSIKSTTGLLSIQYPYLIFTTPQIFTAKTFRQDNGYVSNLSGKVYEFIDPNHPYAQHYLQVDTDKLDLNGMVITEEERDLLYDIMNRGIYINRIDQGGK